MLLVNYFKLKSYIKSLGFNDNDAKQAIKSLRKMDKELLKVFITWFHTREYPDYQVENLSFTDLVLTVKMNEIKAFLFLDWLKKEPDLAKKALRRPTDSIKISEETITKIKENLGSNYKEEVEDTSDISENNVENEKDTTGSNELK
jgi:hypothetical protein